MKPKTDAGKRILLDQLPKLLQGYGKAFQHYNDATVVVVCDLDDKNKDEFIAELEHIKERCSPQPRALFCLAIEEMEAWYLGDMPAVKRAYPSAKMEYLSKYINDSICGTWELLADAIYKGGHVALKKSGWHIVGMEKSKWASNIPPHMDPLVNASPSFNEFVKRVSNLCQL
jgi:hypothetical protein